MDTSPQIEIEEDPSPPKKKVGKTSARAKQRAHYPSIASMQRRHKPANLAVILTRSEEIVCRDKCEVLNPVPVESVRLLAVVPARSGPP